MVFYMRIVKMNLKIILAISSALMLTGCVAPLLIGGGATVGAMATREKGLGGALSDSEISMRIKAKLYGYSRDLHAYVGVNVHDGEVLLTGSVPNGEWPDEAERITKQVYGVKNIFNHINVMKEESIKEAMGSLPQDSWITSQIKSKVLFEKDIRSLNFSIKTVDSVVYLMGIARTQTELDKVVDIASHTSGVKKVINYVKVSSSLESTEDLNPETADTTSFAEAETLQTNGSTMDSDDDIPVVVDSNEVSADRLNTRPL